MAPKDIRKASTVPGIIRKQIEKATSAAGVKDSSLAVSERKWESFRKFCLDESLQEVNVILDPIGIAEPTEALVGKIVEYFH